MPDTSLFHIMKLDFLYDMLNSRENTLVRPDSWDDPYEKQLNNSTITLHVKGEKDETFYYDKNQWFAQCWSLTRESDGLWKSFAPEHKNNVRYVKIETTWFDLYNSFPKDENAISVLERIKYVSARKKKYNKHIKHIWNKYHRKIVSKFDLLYLGLLLTKRKAFQHENEVRFLIDLLEDDCKYIKKDKNIELLQYPVEIGNFIKSIELDPWISDEKADKEIEKIKTLLGSVKIDIKKSTLYEESRDKERYHFHISIESLRNKIIEEVSKLYVM